jgi:hypothetical protein
MKKGKRQVPLLKALFLVQIGFIKAEGTFLGYLNVHLQTQKGAHLQRPFEVPLWLLSTMLL